MMGHSLIHDLCNMQTITSYAGLMLAAQQEAKEAIYRKWALSMADKKVEIGKNRCVCSGGMK